jgi:uncharacterized OB-fold protein
MKGDGGKNISRQRRILGKRCTVCGKPHVDRRKGACVECLAKKRNDDKVRREKLYTYVVEDGVVDLATSIEKHPTYWNKVFRRSKPAK